MILDKKPRATAKRLADFICNEIEDTALAWKCSEVLKPFDGKQITKRMATTLQKALPEYDVRYVNQYGMFHIEVYPLRKAYKSKYLLALLLGHESSRVFDWDRFVSSHANCYLGAADDRNTRRTAQLADTATLTKLAKAINAHNAALVTIADVLGHPYECCYSIPRAFVVGPVGKDS